MAFELTEYPPRSFCEKYGKFLAPRGVLVAPQQALRQANLGPAAGETLRKAFKITIKKLRKMRSACAACDKKEGVLLECEECKAVRYCSEGCRQARATFHCLVCQNLKEELVDQVVECLPAPLTPGPQILKGRGGLVRDWDDWFKNHTHLGDSFVSCAQVIAMWWGYTSLPSPGELELEASLQRIFSNVFSTPLTIGLCASWFPGLHPPQQRETDEFHIHLLGADKPEVKAVEEGIIQIASRILGCLVVVTLVAPDLTHHPQTLAWSPTSPLVRIPKVKAVAYPGLYHDFWQEHVAVADPTQQVRRPDVALAIHPGVHTGAMMALWKPTLQLLAKECVPLAITTYNLAEFEETLEKLIPLGLNIINKGKNPLASLHAKQTPYEPDHIWAANSYFIAIDNRCASDRDGSGSSTCTPPKPN